MAGRPLPHAAPRGLVTVGHSRVPGPAGSTRAGSAGQPGDGDQGTSGTCGCRVTRARTLRAALGPPRAWGPAEPSAAGRAGRPSGTDAAESRAEPGRAEERTCADPALGGARQRTRQSLVPLPALSTALTPLLLWFCGAAPRRNVCVCKFKITEEVCGTCVTRGAENTAGDTLLG